MKPHEKAIATERSPLNNYEFAKGAKHPMTRRITSKTQSSGYVPRRSTVITMILINAGRIPLLTAEQEIELSRQVQAYLPLKEKAEKHPETLTDEERQTVHVGKKAKKKMIEANLRLVIATAKRYLNCGMEFEDLIQEGNLGLEKAVEKFDYKLGYRFSSYASWWVMQGISRELKNKADIIRLPVYLLNDISAIKKAAKELMIETGNRPSKADIAKHLGWTFERFQRIRQASILKSLASLDAPVRNAKQQEESSLGDFIADDQDVWDEVERLAQKDQVQKLMEISGISERERLILTLYYGLNGDKEQTLSEIGEQLGLTRERIRVLRDNALRLLRQVAQSGESPENIPQEERARLAIARMLKEGTAWSKNRFLEESNLRSTFLKKHPEIKAEFEAACRQVARPDSRKAFLQAVAEMKASGIGKALMPLCEQIGGYTNSILDGRPELIEAYLEALIDIQQRGIDPGQAKWLERQIKMMHERLARMVQKQEAA